MKRYFFLPVCCLILACSAFSQQTTGTATPGSFNCGDNLKDARDGQNYGTVQIGQQCWMKQNLNLGTMIKGKVAQADNNVIEKYCFDDKKENCDVYGGLYQWNEVMQYNASQGGRGICPSGWHVPTDAEWTDLVTFLGGDVPAGGKLKEAGDAHYMLPNFGANNSSGFTSLPGGYSYATNGFQFDKLKAVGYYWTSTAENTTDVWIRTLGYANEKIGRYLNYKTTGSSVRCIMDKQK